MSLFLSLVLTVFYSPIGQWSLFVLSLISDLTDDHDHYHYHLLATQWTCTNYLKIVLCVNGFLTPKLDDTRIPHHVNVSNIVKLSEMPNRPERCCENTGPFTRDGYKYSSTQVLSGEVIIREAFYCSRACAVLFLATTFELSHYMHHVSSGQEK